MRRSIKIGIASTAVALMSATGLAGVPTPAGAQDATEAGGGEAHCGYPAVFNDVGPGHPFETEIYWLVNEGVIAGFHVDCTFRSTLPASRQAMAAWLYRFKAVDPAFVDPLTATFQDTPTTSTFFTEIEWLAQLTPVVTNGYSGAVCDAVPTSSPCYRPANPISRQAMAAFLYRYAGEPAFTPPGVATYNDTPVGSPFFKEVEWLDTTGITTGYTTLAQCGTPANTPCFKPTTAVSRQATAAFLYRYDNTAGLPRLASIDDAAAPAGGGDAGDDAAAPAAAGGGSDDAAAPAAASDGGSDDAAAPAAAGGGSDTAATDATTGGVSADASGDDEVALSLTEASDEDASGSGLLVKGGAIALVAAGLAIAATRRRNSTIS